MQYDWNWSILIPYAGAFARGVVWTLVLTLAAVAAGTLGGILWGLVLAARGRRWTELKWILLFINDVTRALPLLILLLMVNYYGASLLGLRSTFWTAALAMSLNLAAFVADVLRGAIRGVPRPHIDAGLALGMSDAQILMRITLPEALRSMVPTIALLYIDMLKMSSLASVIAYPELTYTGSQVIALQFRPLEVFALIAAIYVAIVMPLSYFQRALEESRWVRRRS
jgi:polar amino acid transport system permease protein